MLDFNFKLNHKCVCVYVCGRIILLKWGARLSSIRFIDFLNLKIKNKIECE